MFDIVTFGRRMMEHSVNLNDDALCNSFARVGDMLIRFGQPRAPKNLSDLSAADQMVIASAIELFGYRR